MLLHHRHPTRPRDVVVDVLDPEGTVADLAVALAPDQPAAPLEVDGRVVPAATPLDRAGIGDGSVVAPVPDRAAPAEAPATHVITVTTGLDAGRRFALAPGRYRLGRAGDPAGPVDPDPDADADPADDVRSLAVHEPTLSRRHLTLTVTDREVTVHDVGSRNGTRLDGTPLTEPHRWPPGAVVACGRATLTLSPAPVGDDDGPAPPPGPPPWPRHRRPRPVPAPPEPPLDPLPPAETPPTVTPVGALAIVASVAVGGVMVLVLHSWTYALFALLGPVLMLANALDSRFRRRRARRTGGAKRRKDLARFAAEVDARRDRHRSEHAARHPGAARAVTDADALVPAAGCWERRADDPGAFTVRLGRGTVPWEVPVEGLPRTWPDDVQEAVADRSRVTEAAVTVTLGPRRPLAIVGPPGPARALARAVMVQAAVDHGPADLRVAVLAAADRAPAWDWCGWLPHTREPATGRLVAGDGDGAQAVADALVAPPDGGGARPRRLVVIDDPAGLAARRGPTRSVVRAAQDPEAGLVPLVIAEDGTDVPASCRVVTVTADGTLGCPDDVAVGPAEADGVALDVAAAVARRLARLDDPEVDDPGRGLPARIALASLLGPERLSPAALAARWRAAGADPPPRAVLGLAADGPVTVDLAADGPHALVAGTTGAGKSELLRSLVLSLAVTSSPDHLTFVLVDFKGGSAFDACARLPHTTGLVTDLDPPLAERALRCLEAELRHRERRLRAAGAGDLAELRAALGPDDPPLPRLVVVVDEFATLAAELPEFVDALVGVAQRGRSLGVHLVLATQRPSGAVSENIRANTALRIALRVHDGGDSSDVIDVADAAALPRRRPGRALVRFGPGDLAAVQTAYAGAHALDPEGAGPPVRVRPLTLRAVGPAGDGPAGVDEPGTAPDLVVVTAAIARAWADGGGAPPRPPWPAPLPTEIAWPVPADVGAIDDGVPPRGSVTIGVADDPDHQCRRPYRWRPADGPLLVVGLPGSGTSTVLATTVLAVAAADPGDWHVHVIDLGAGDQAPLAGLPQVGAVVGADELERQRRLIDDLALDLAARRADPHGPAPRRLLVVDGVGAFQDRWDDLATATTWPRFVDVVTRGSEVGIHVVLAAEGATRVPHRVLAGCRQRLVLKLGEPADHATFGIPAAAVPPLGPGRGLDPDGPTLVQVARPPDGVAAAVARLCAPGPGPAAVAPRPVRVLPPAVSLADAAAGEPTAACAADGRLVVVVGRSDVDLGPARFDLPPGGHALVAGPPQSGRTTALATLAAAATATGRGVLFVARTPPRLAAGVTWAGPDADLADLLERLTPVLVVVDDADLTAEDHPALTALVTDRRADRHVVVATRADRARTLYGHWMREVRADRAGLLLAPDPDLDGELTGARLPRRSPVAAGPGRGWLSGRPEGFVQVASPPDALS